MARNTYGTLLLVGLVVVLLFWLWPQIASSAAGTKVSITEAKLYDASGKLLGSVKPTPIGSWAIPDDGGEATTAIVQVSYEIWYYDSSSVPAAPTVDVWLIQAKPTGAYIAPDETPMYRRTAVGQWTYEGTSRKGAGKDYKFSGTAEFSLDAEEIADEYNLGDGQSITMQAAVDASAGNLKDSARSANTLTLKMAEAYNAALVIESVRLS